MTTSTINPAVPVQSSALTSAPIRQNFAAAYNDINSILAIVAGGGGELWPTTGVPLSSLGNNNDYAIDKTNGVIYGPKAAGAWPAGVGFVINGGTVNASLNAAILSTSPSGGIGYATGAGGTVSQITSKATGVTLNKITGTITMNAAALAGGTIVSFILSNTSVAATDLLVLNHDSGGTLGSYGLNAATATNAATIYVRNNTAGSLSEALVIAFAVIKGATA